MMHAFEKFLVADRSSREIIKMASRAAATESTVLIEGESGVGKDLLATCIHYASRRAEGPMVRIDCPNLSEDLLECELFGYEPGAFTDARGRKMGKFELANGGTLYIDGIDTLPLILQSKLLRPLQERAIERLGSTSARKLDVRVIASSQHNLVDEVRKGMFRGDLFYRLQVIHLRIPPLRERKADIPALALHLSTDAGARAAKPGFQIASDALSLLARYDWPGNVRELRNVIERLAVMALDTTATREDILAALPSIEPLGRQQEPLTLREMEIVYIQEVLRRARGNKSRAASILGISRKSFYDRLKREGGTKLH